MGKREVQKPKTKKAKELPRDQKVGIFVPSRYAGGGVVTPEKRDHEIRTVAGMLAKRFGGASAEDLVKQATPIVGTFVHAADRSERFVDEGVLRVWAAVTAEQIENRSDRRAVRVEANRLRDQLEQECVLIEWGPEVEFTKSKTHPGRPVSFGALQPELQMEFALMAWHRVTQPTDLAGVLSLAGWEFADKPRRRRRSPSRIREKIAWKQKETGERVAWEWRGEADPQAQDLGELEEGDLLVQAASESQGKRRALRVWRRTESGHAGPRAIPLAGTKPTPRVAIEFVLALLDGASKLNLEAFLDAEGATARFYREVRHLIEAVAKAVPGKDRKRANAIAQRLLGRLLFVRFVEEKQWLPSQYLRSRWGEQCSGYYRDVVVELFRLLDTPRSKRAGVSDDIPYLNGGLFSLRQEDADIDLPDALFNPKKPRSILKTLYRYQITLDESAARESTVSVDPAMLGRVLESLTPGEERKSKGVHYTPEPVARALAQKGILPQLVRRVAARGLKEIDESTLERLCSLDRKAVSGTQARVIQQELRSLRIVDPAVGSGALLVACLEVLLELERGCRRVLGGDLERGSLDWAESARHFIRECLYGVDISPEAIEVAQLRLWLFLAVGEEEETALPDLGYNLRVGDSLAFDAAEDRLMEVFSNRDSGVRELEFGGTERALNRALDARRAFVAAGEGEPAARQQAFRDLEERENELRNALGDRKRRPGEAPPFAWGVHFPEVFQSENRGFDLVIANPPYVRTSSLDEAQSRELKERYASMSSKNVDLYYTFVERALRAPLKPGEAEQTASNGDGTAKKTPRAPGLAGRSGGVAFILPSFAQTTSAEKLRELLAEGGHVDLWVDFVAHQVFPTATNYVALLFASAKRRDRKRFSSRIVTREAFDAMVDGERWLEDLSENKVTYEAAGWHVRGRFDPGPGETRLLGEIAKIEVGIQTSLDPFFLLEPAVVGSHAGKTLIMVKNGLGEEVELETGALFRCAKGSGDLKKRNEFEGRRFVLWPFDDDGQPLEKKTLRAKFPRAWQYILAHRGELEAREKGALKGKKWWLFRRPQGVKVATRPKILVPSMMREPTAYLDRKGEVICTASGKGGGGGWVLTLKEDSGTALSKLAEYLQSEELQQWLETEAEPKQGGWWGVDRKTLERCPVPVAKL